MTRYSFLLSARWLKYIAMTIIVVIACVFLALWQKERRTEREHEIETINANYAAEPVDIDAVLGSRSTQLDEDGEWRPVSLTGEFAAADTVLARNRTVDDKVGFYVVVPFRLTTGGTIAIVRGWVPEADAVPAPPEGQQTITARLRPAQDGSDDDNPAGMIKAIDPARIPGMGEAYAHVYAEEAATGTAAATGLTPLPPPDLNPGNHLSYMLQWFAFGIMIIIAVSISARRERRVTAEALGAQSAETEYIVVDKAALDAGAKVAQPGSRYGRGRFVSPSANGPDEAEEDEILEQRFWRR